ncbi:serine/threonine-protein kinase [Sphaerisporangium corydalis]|uniref:non-specific serine/threonine protein kinase n=1 Tax=Sphaerisporangium corydalis TaxID=1441875 RepID=A0ABV9EPD2_9ACTN|nr:serine/threonine protein kinase [Sphaerisporangium corydalis]
MSEARPDGGRQGRRVAGRYQLLEPIGRGGMGIVWRAHDELLDRAVAVKEVRYPGDPQDDEVAELNRRTLREARAAGRLTHPNVVVVHDVIEENGRPWIVMQLVDARSLGQVLRDDGPLPVRMVAEIGLQILEALRTAHAAGVLHRDVKPENVLLTDDGRVVLTDFGIARMETDTTMTRTGLVGTPAFIAPERLRGHSAQRESDLWSLGATLYAAVEGRPPHDKGMAMATMHAVLNDEPEPALRAGRLGAVLSGLLEKDPDRRLSADQAERMLRAVAEDRSSAPPASRLTMPATPLPVPPTSPPRKRPKEPRRPAEGARPQRPAPEAVSPVQADGRAGAEALERVQSLKQAPAPGKGAPPAKGAPPPASATPAEAPPGKGTPPGGGPSSGRGASSGNGPSSGRGTPSMQGQAYGAPAPDRDPAAEQASPSRAAVPAPRDPAGEAPGADDPTGPAIVPAPAREDAAASDEPSGESAAGPGTDAGPPDPRPAPESPRPAARKAPVQPVKAPVQPVRPPVRPAEPPVTPGEGPETHRPTRVPRPARSPEETRPETRRRPYAPAPATGDYSAAGPPAGDPPTSIDHGATSVDHAATSMEPPLVPMAGGDERGGRPLPLLRVALVAVPAVLVVAGVALWLGARDASDTTGARSSASGAAASPGASTSAPESDPPSGSPSTSPPASPSATPSETPKPSATPKPDKPGPGDVPKGWHKYKDGTGFSIALPKGWRRAEQSGTQITFRGPDADTHLLIDQTTTPKSNAKKDWENQEPSARGRFPGYRLVGIKAVDYWKTAADWEFTYSSGGGRAHVVNRGFVTGKHHGYALYWKTSDKDWKKRLDLFHTFAATFKPAK